MRPLREALGEAVQARYAARERELTADLLRTLERWVMLHVIDSQWKDHLLSMDHLKEGIGLRGYGQRDPLTEYKREAFDLFEEMVDRVRTTVTELLFKMQVGDQQDHSTISAFSMITSSAGTSWWPDFMVVDTPLMASTTSMPSTTSPNTA